MGFRGWRSAAGEAYARAVESARAGVLRRCHKNVLCDAPERGEEPPHRKPRPAGRGCVGGVPADRTHNAPYGSGVGRGAGGVTGGGSQAAAGYSLASRKAADGGGGRSRLARSPAGQARSSSYGFGVGGSEFSPALIRFRQSSEKTLKRKSLNLSPREPFMNCVWSLTAARSIRCSIDVALFIAKAALSIKSLRVVIVASKPPVSG